MPKLNLVNAKGIKFGGSEVLKLKGPSGIAWAKPTPADNALPTQLSLLTLPYECVGWDYQPISENSCRLIPNGSSNRCHCTWSVTDPEIDIGHWFRTYAAFPAGSNRLLIRSGTEARIGGSAGHVYDNSSHVAGYIERDYVEYGALNPYFGFLTVAARELVVSEFQLLSPAMRS